MATIKQKLAFKQAVKGSSLTKAMVAAGFSPKSAKHTNTLTRTKGWQELVDKYISEEDLMKVHREGLKATKRQGVGGMVIGMGKDGVDSIGHSDIDVPDYAVRHKYLETGYKVRGRLKEQEHGNTTNILNIIAPDQAERIARRVLDGDSESTGTLNRLSDSNESEV